jgi:hypothetical protein
VVLTIWRGDDYMFGLDLEVDAFFFTFHFRWVSVRCGTPKIEVYLSGD